MATRKFSLLDNFIVAVDNGLRTLFASNTSSRPNPSLDQPQTSLLPQDRKKSAALMRVNHTGEVCAQALYYGQALGARSESVKQTLLRSADEETDHLVWCKERLDQLSDHTSYLNPLFYVASFSLGLISGVISDKWSLGFVVETENQVEQHLKAHLHQLPEEDQKSKRILEQMQEDEAKHASVARTMGAKELPDSVKTLMRMMSKVMTTTTYYI